MLTVGKDHQLFMDDEQNISIESLPSGSLNLQQNSYKDLSCLVDESPTEITSVTYSSLNLSMQHFNGSLEGSGYLPRNGMNTGMQKQLNQNHITAGTSEPMQNFHKKGVSAERSSYANYILNEKSRESADAMNSMMSNTSQFLHTGNPEDVPPDDSLHELLQEQKMLNSYKTLDNPKQHSATKHSMYNTGTISYKLGPSYLQHAANSGPAESQIVKATISQSTVHKSPQETVYNKRDLSKPHIWPNGETKTETNRKEFVGIVESSGQHLVHVADQEFSNSGSSICLRSPNQPLSSIEASCASALGSNAVFQKQPSYMLVRSKSFDYRNCVSDTEDQKSWLEKQHSKLRYKREGAMMKERLQQEKQLMSELKRAQTAIGYKRQSQSDTEDMSPDDRNDFQTHLQNMRMFDQHHENMHVGDGRGFAVQTVMMRPINKEDFNCDQHLAKDNYTHVLANKTQMSQRSLQLSSDQFQPMSGLKSGQISCESTELIGFEWPISSLNNGHDAPNLDELERILKMTMQSMSKSNIFASNALQGFDSSDIRLFQNQKENGSPITSWSLCQTPNPNESEEKEVIELKPIGQGVRMLERESSSRSSPISYPVQVVVSPFPVSPTTAPENNGLSSVRHASPSSASEREDNIEFDLQQQQQLIKQQLLQQQVKQQQLQQQHQLLKQKLQEHQQQLIQQQQLHIQPQLQHHLMQQQQLFEQQLLQQQQQLLSLQQQLQQQQQQQSWQVDSPFQQMQLQEERVVSSEGNLPHVSTSLQKGNLPFQNDSSVNSISLQKIMAQNHNVKSMTCSSNSPESDDKKNAQNVEQAPRLKNSGTALLQNSLQRKTGNSEQQKMQQIKGFSAEMEPSNERLQTLGKTPSAVAYSKLKTDLTPGSTQHFFDSEKQRLIQLQQQQQQHQQLRLHQQQLQLQKQQEQHLSQRQCHNLDQQTTAANSRSPGFASGKETAEDVIGKVHAVISGGNRAISPLETVFGLKEKSTNQMPYAVQLQGLTGGKEAVERMTFVTSPSFQALIKSPPPVLADSSRSLLSPNQIISSPDVPYTLQQALSGPGSPDFGSSRAENTFSQDLVEEMYQTPRFVQDNCQCWHKPNLTRAEVIAFLKDKPPGSFIIRNSNTFQGAYGLAVKVAQIPPNVKPQSEDPDAELVRHFLIESLEKGFRIKGCSNEPIFGSLAVLVYQHSITPLALPCKLILPELEVSDGDDMDAKSSGSVNSEGLIASSNMFYISSTDLETLTGPEAVSRAIEKTFDLQKSSPTITEVHFKATSAGITLTDNKRRLFFRRHYPFNMITYCGFDTKDRRLSVTDENAKSISTGRVFGFVARKLGSTTENSCHLFSELDYSQPASSIVNSVQSFINSSNLSLKS